MKMETNPWKPCEKKCECKAVGSCLPISTNESQVKHQKHLYFLFSFLLRIWIPIFRLKPLSRPHDWLLDDPSRGFVKVNLFSSSELFSCWNKGQRYQIKTKNSKETPKSHCLKKKKFTITKTTQISFSHQFAHNSGSRSRKPGDPRDEEVDFYLCSVTFVLHDTCLCLITRLASLLRIYDGE